MKRKLSVAVFLFTLVASFVVSLLSPSLFGLPQAGLKAQSLPTITFSRSRIPNIASHIATAQARGYPSILTRTTISAEIDQNRREACRNFISQPPNNTSCDEYPFASSREGGAGSSIRAVPPTEQNIQGGIISSFYRNNSIRNGSRFRVRISG
ncbi:NucA/NucB deoxyribonuclease domain-containing protein [Nostoc sp. MG11]|uniref:NucA/NucB deoxyribonuclease domain-containing protein n=1 Tax=Nostoc sp. MG11 TaxID=2721166 RepID=UPI001865A5B8|nr:NucA/NucB deoxyribonuclease domain-containing protein [Nostoc sp. MG11]